MIVADRRVFSCFSFRIPSASSRPALAGAPGRAPWGYDRGKSLYSLVSLDRACADHLGLWRRHAQTRSSCSDAARLDAARRGAADRHRLRADRRGLRAADEDQGGARSSDDGGRRAVGARSPARQRPTARRACCSAHSSSGPWSCSSSRRAPRSRRGHDVSARQPREGCDCGRRRRRRFASVSRCSCMDR